MNSFWHSVKPTFGPITAYGSLSLFNWQLRAPPHLAWKLCKHVQGRKIGVYHWGKNVPFISVASFTVSPTMNHAHGSFDLLPDNFEEDDNFYKNFFLEKVSLIITQDISVTQLLNTNIKDLKDLLILMWLSLKWIWTMTVPVQFPQILNRIPVSFFHRCIFTW